MGKKCVVPNCTSGYDSNKEKVSVFSIPEDKLAHWQRVIRRKDRKLTVRDVVCAKHFREEDIIRVVTTATYSYDLKTPRLSKDAVPCIFPKCSAFMTKTKKRLLEQAELPTVKRRRRKIQILEDDVESDQSCQEANYSTVFLKSESEDPLRLDGSAQQGQEREIKTEVQCEEEDGEEEEADEEEIEEEGSPPPSNIEALTAEVKYLRAEVARLKQELLESKQNELKLGQVVNAVAELVTKKDVQAIAVNVKQEKD